ncbi:F-box domain-containing protein [Caenorhabditis elegans]|uniref:F-box domain-containing protein n=1 Tax=Caenorhabditis elegans TaxID=6239 RepID=H2KZS8_CAEEL|nr:F-box domain-containing protein [Caenorhabditis elegans]CCD69566.1 F-box domain-containing protein [Caenorhabditis elegans]|eukprot:NP_001023809.1 Uncharacterized protein CELE_F16B4.2 [Caenorhabditis elegans]
MLRRRIHEILSRKFPKWVFEERLEPLDWSFLPVEIRREVVKHTDFQTRCRLRQCSLQDQQIVDSLLIELPFVRIETDKNYVSVLICESKTSILRIDLAKRKIRLRKKFVMNISDNILGKNAKEVQINHEFDTIIESLLNAISRINVSVSSLNLYIKYPIDAVINYLDVQFRQQTGPKRKTKIICSGMEFLMGQVHFLPVDEVRVINDLITNYEEGRMMLAGKKYNVSPSGHYAEIGETAFWKPTLLNCNLGALIAGIIWKINTEMECYCIPGLDVPEYQEYCARFEGQITEYRNTRVLHIPVPETTRKLFVLINKCGVVIQKANIDDVVHIPKEKCILDWTCSTCDKTIESWYFRSTLGMNE